MVQSIESHGTCHKIRAIAEAFGDSNITAEEMRTLDAPPYNTNGKQWLLC